MEGRYHPFRFPAEPVALHGPFAVRKHPLAFRAAAFQKCKNINMARLQLIQFSAKSASKKFFTFTSLSLLLHYDEASPQNQSPFMGQSPLVNTHKGFSRGILEIKNLLTWHELQQTQYSAKSSTKRFFTFTFTFTSLR